MFFGIIARHHGQPKTQDRQPQTDKLPQHAHAADRPGQVDEVGGDGPEDEQLRRVDLEPLRLGPKMFQRLLERRKFR